MTAMYCATCDRIETDPIALDAERCLRCAGTLCQHEPSIEIISRRSFTVGQVEVNFTVGRIRKDRR